MKEVIKLEGILIILTIKYKKVKVVRSMCNSTPFLPVCRLLRTRHGSDIFVEGKALWSVCMCLIDLTLRQIKDACKFFATSLNESRGLFPSPRVCDCFDQ